MTETKEERLSKIRRRLDVLTDNIESSMEDIEGYVTEKKALLVELWEIVK